MDLEESVKNWLIEEKMFKEKVDDPSANFHYIIEFPQNNIIDVIQPKAKADAIIIGCATQVAPEHIELMKSSTSKNLNEFIWDVRLSLNQFLVDFDLNVTDNILNQFVITEDIYIDELSKHNFIKGVKKVFKAKINCVWLIEKYFGEIPPSKNDAIFV